MSEVSDCLEHLHEVRQRKIFRGLYRATRNALIVKPLRGFGRPRESEYRQEKRN